MLLQKKRKKNCEKPWSKHPILKIVGVINGYQMCLFHWETSDSNSYLDNVCTKTGICVLCILKWISDLYLTIEIKPHPYLDDQVWDQRTPSADRELPDHGDCSSSRDSKCQCPLAFLLLIHSFPEQKGVDLNTLCHHVAPTCSWQPRDQDPSDLRRSHMTACGSGLCLELCQWKSHLSFLPA